MRIPYVSVCATGRGAEASAGFALRSLLSERLLEDPRWPADRAERLQQAHRDSVRLMQLLCGWNWPVRLELHLVSRPSLDPRQAGHVQIGVKLDVAMPDREKALERCLSSSVTLESLLETCWRHAEFEPISDPLVFENHFRPFEADSALAVTRRAESISLAQPFRPTAKLIGFRRSPAPSAPPEVAKGVVEHLFAWIPAPDDWSAMLGALLLQPTPLWLLVRMANGADASAALDRLDSAIARCEGFLACAPPDQTTLAGQAAALRDACLARALQLRADALRGTVLLLAPGPADEVLAALVGQAISGDRVPGPAVNLYQGGFEVCAVPTPDIPGRFEEEPFTVTEAACCFRLPLIFGEEDLGLEVRRHRTLLAGLPRPAGGGPTVLGISRHRGLERPVEIDLGHRMRHMALFGMTGTGKSTMLESLFLQDLRAGHGCCFVDPHGDSADQILARFPEEREHDLIVIDFEDRERPIPMNLLAWKTIEERDLIIDEMLSALVRIYKDPGMFGPVFEQNFRGVMKLLMGDKPQRRFTGTLLEFPKVYRSSAFRRHLAEDIEDEQVKDFLAEAAAVSYGDGKLENLAPYITNKFGRFLQDTLLRRIVGHGAIALDFTSILEGGKVVILKLARGRFGSNVSDLITSQIVRRFRLAAMARASRPKHQRRPYFLYVDEFGTLAGDDTFASLLSESRKYGLGLVLAAQYAGQLRDEHSARSMLSAVLGNVGTVLCYRVGAEDAPLLAPIFAPWISSQDLLECPNWQGYMRLHLNRFPVRPFSFQNLPDETPPCPERRKRLVEASRCRWGVSAEECDANALKRSRFIQSLARED